MKTNKQFLLNLLVYMVIILGILFLYFPLNNSPENEAHSAISFVYQQF
jgi:hypothetical protein